MLLSHHWSLSPEPLPGGVQWSSGMLLSCIPLLPLGAPALTIAAKPASELRESLALPPALAPASPRLAWPGQEGR